MRWIHVFVTALPYLASCGTHLLSLRLEDVHPSERVSAVSDPRLVIGSGDDVIIVSGPPNAWDERQLARKEVQTAEVPLLALPAESSWCGYDAERLLAGEDGYWWYSRCAGGARSFSIRVVTSSSPSAPSSIAVSRDPKTVVGWLPIGDGDPEGVLLSSAGGAQLRAEIVSAAGTKELGTFVRNDSAVITQQTWQAHRLDAGRILVVSLEFDDRSGTALILQRLFSTDGVQESRLPFAANAKYVSIASAVDERGDLAVVAATPHSVAAVLIGLVHGESPATPRVLADEGISTTASSGVRLIDSAGRFIAVWINDPDREVRLAEFGRPVAHHPAITIAEGAAESLLAVSRSGEAIDVFWSANDGVTRRRLPDRPSGYIIASQLWVRWRRAFESSLASESHPPAAIDQ